MELTVTNATLHDITIPILWIAASEFTLAALTLALSAPAEVRAAASTGVAFHLAAHAAWCFG